LIGIIGGGLTGLTLANNLHGRFELLEGSGECGGLCRSLKEDGYTFDYGGGHVIFSKDQGAMNYMLSALGKNVVQNRRNTKIYYKGRFVKYPFENGLSELPPEDNFECLYYFIRAVMDKEKPAPNNFREWIYQTFGKGIAEKYLIPYNEKIWNFKTEDMNLDWIAGRVPQPPMEDVIKSSVGMPTEGYAHQLNFYYPERGGIQSLTDALESKVKDRVTKNFKVSRIKKEGERFVVSDGKSEKNYARLVWTAPLPELIAALKAPREVKDAAAGLKWNSLTSVMLGIDTPKLNDFSWAYFPTPEDGRFNRVNFLSNYSPNMAPKGKSSLLAEICSRQGDPFYKKKDEELIRHVAGKLGEKKIIDEKKVVFSRVKRLEYAYIIYDLDYNRNLSAVTDFVKGQGIELCGRFAEFRYINMDACVRSALNKAAEINAIC
jgi:protoporphyrinogen oxidase